MIGQVFKRKGTENFYKLKRVTEGNINTYIECDNLGNPIVKKRAWSSHPQEQPVMFIGFNKLEKCD